jgi:hypothetical protein
MPRYQTRVEHELGQQQAIDRLSAFVAKAGCTCGLVGEWSGPNFDFSVKTQGIGLQGSLRVDACSIHLDAQVPLIALPFTGWFPRILATALEQGGSPEPRAPRPAADDRPIVLFLHIPKAGGSTLGEYIFNHCRDPEGADDGLVNSGVYFCPFGFFKEPGLKVPDYAQEIVRRADLRAVLGHFWYGLHHVIGRPTRYVTLLRNPVERVISLYYYLKLEGRMSLEEFAITAPHKEVENDQTRRIAGVDPEVGGCNEATLELAKNNLRRDFAVVGVVERLDETLSLLREAFGWTDEIPCVARNVNSDRPSRASLPSSALDAIRARNELDLELYEHVHRLMDQALVGLSAKTATVTEMANS